MGNKLQPVFGELDAAAKAFKQLGAQLLFQLLDLYRDGGLRIPQLLGRTGKTLQFRNPQKGGDGTQLHTMPLLLKKVNDFIKSIRFTNTWFYATLVR